MKFLVVPASAVLLLGSAAALAQTNDNRFDDATDQSAATQRFVDRTFGNIDDNQDGTIDRTEWTAFMTNWLAERRERFDRRFKKADENGDGHISRTEAERNEPVLAQRFADVDRDSDSLLSAREIRQAIRRKQTEQDD